MTKAWFVTGTDTGVGKTRVAQAMLHALVGAGYRAVGMKPIATGCRETPGGLRNDDAEALMQAGNVEAVYADVNPYAFAPAISPHLAAREAKLAIRLETIRECYARLAGRADRIVVEGAGGWFAPVSAEQSIAQVALALGLPVVLVVGMRLGCLNHALLTQAAIVASGLPFAGWVANRVESSMDRLDDNVATLKQRLRAPLFAEFPHGAPPPESTLKMLAKMLNDF